MKINKISIIKNNYLKNNNFKTNYLGQMKLNKIVQDTISFNGSKTIYIEDVKRTTPEQLEKLITQQKDVAGFLTRYDYTMEDGFTTPLHIADSVKAKILLEASPDDETTKWMIYARNGSKSSVFKDADFDKINIIIKYLEKINEDVNYFANQDVLLNLDLQQILFILLSLKNDSIVQHILLNQDESVSAMYFLAQKLIDKKQDFSLNFLEATSTNNKDIN